MNAALADIMNIYKNGKSDETFLMGTVRVNEAVPANDAEFHVFLLKLHEIVYAQYRDLFVDSYRWAFSTCRQEGSTDEYLCMIRDDDLYEVANIVSDNSD